MLQFAVILAAAGMSQRFRDPHYKKTVVPLAGRPLWMYAAEAFSNRNDVAQIIMVISAEDRESFVEKFGGNLALLGAQLVLGGATRAESVQNGLKEVRADIPSSPSTMPRGLASLKFGSTPYSAKPKPPVPPS